MLNTGLQLPWEMQQKAKPSSDPTTNIQYNSQRKTKQLANPTALFGNGFFPPKAPLQHIWSFHHPAQLLLGLESEPGLWQDVLQQTPGPAGTGRAAPSTDDRRQHKLSSSAPSLAFVPGMSWEKASSQSSQQAFSYGMYSLRGKAENKKGMRHLNQRGKRAVLPGSSLCQRRIPLKRVIAISISIDSHGRECSLGDFYSLTDHGNRKMLLMLKLHTSLFSFGPLFPVPQLQAVC